MKRFLCKVCFQRKQFSNNLVTCPSSIRYCCFVRDSNKEPGDDFAVLATVDSPRSPGVLAAALGRVPRSVFVNECTSEPDEITNCVPDLLPRSAIQEWYCGSNESSMAHFARAYSEAGSQ